MSIDKQIFQPPIFDNREPSHQLNKLRNLYNILITNIVDQAGLVNNGTLKMSGLKTKLELIPQMYMTEQIKLKIISFNQLFGLNAMRNITVVFLPLIIKHFVTN